MSVDQGTASLIERVRKDAYEAGLVVGARKAEWRGIETAPRDGTEILLFGAGYLVDDPRRYATTCHVGWLDGDHWATRDPELICDATHWMPLPEPPAK